MVRQDVIFHIISNIVIVESYLANQIQIIINSQLLLIKSLFNSTLQSLMNYFQSTLFLLISLMIIAILLLFSTFHPLIYCIYYQIMICYMQLILRIYIIHSMSSHNSKSSKQLTQSIVIVTTFKRGNLQVAMRVVSSQTVMQQTH